MCSTDVTVQNKPAAVAPKETVLSFLRFWNWASIDAAKICGGEGNVKRKPSKHS